MPDDALSGGAGGVDDQPVNTMDCPGATGGECDIAEVGCRCGCGTAAGAKNLTVAVCVRAVAHGFTKVSAGDGRQAEDQVDGLWLVYLPATAEADFGCVE